MISKIPINRRNSNEIKNPKSSYESQMIRWNPKNPKEFEKFHRNIKNFTNYLLPIQRADSLENTKNPESYKKSINPKKSHYTTLQHYPTRRQEHSKSTNDVWGQR